MFKKTNLPRVLLKAFAISMVVLLVLGLTISHFASSAAAAPQTALTAAEKYCRDHAIDVKRSLSLLTPRKKAKQL